MNRATTTSMVLLLMPIMAGCGPSATAADGEESTAATTSEDLTTDTGAESDTETETGPEPEPPDPCPNPEQPAECPVPNNFGNFTADFAFPSGADRTCVVMSTAQIGLTLVDLSCQDEQGTWATSELSIAVDPSWVPPPVGTMLRARRYVADFDGSEGSWESWRIELLDSGRIVAGMVRDMAELGFGSYEEWTLSTQMVWDWEGCIEECESGPFDHLWLRISDGEQSVTMYPGDRCDLRDTRIWLATAYGDPCLEYGDVGAELLVLGTNLR